MSTHRQILRWDKKGPLKDSDELAREEPLEIRVETRPVSVTMRTPGHDRELATGFLLSEGLITSKEDILDIKPYPREEAGNVIDVFLSPNVKVDFASLTRHVFASSSCGICGKASIDAVHRQFPPATSELKVEARTLLSLPQKLQGAQETFARTGGLHAAALFDPSGNLVTVREDVGRHNAVDKVLGYGLLKGLLPFDHQILLVSGRASFEIMQKALAGRIAIVAAVSAPSSLAVDFAEASGQTLVGFLRGERMNIYAHAQRVRLPAPDQR